MKKFANTVGSLALVLLISFGLAGCGSHENHDHDGQQDEDSNSASSGAATVEVAAYPLETCVVSGEALDSMGGPVDKTYTDQEVKFCCKSCIDTFEEDSAKYLAQIDVAAKKNEDSPQP